MGTCKPNEAAIRAAHDNATYGDVCLAERGTGRLIITKATEDNLRQYPIEKYVPIGVVAIPSSHNVYGDGKCGVISLKEMSCDSPDEGSMEPYPFYWGGMGSEDSGLKKFDVVVVMDLRDKHCDGSVAGTSPFGAFLPSDNIRAFFCPNDEKACYRVIDPLYWAVPSPYMDDETRNMGYCMTEAPSSDRNAFSDFDGVGNTRTLIGLSTAQSGWKTDKFLKNESGKGFYPASCCCWRYRTEGTTQGDWYLPAMGELGYVMARMKSINGSISVINNVYGLSYGRELGYVAYWSSTEHSGHSARSLDMHSGYSNDDGKDYTNCVRAFTRV